MKKIVIAGGAGFLGQAVSRHFERKGWRTVILTRRLESERIASGTPRRWDGRTVDDWVNELEGARCLLNLCGKSVNCRYTTRNREELIRSRLAPTTALAKALQQIGTPPPVWLNASSATIYQHSETEAMDEDNGIIGDGFSVDLCQAWERALFKAELPNVRRVALRSSMVLGNERNSVFPVLARIARLRMGGGLGKGEQLVSWIHEQDFARAVEFAIEDESVEGPLNVTAPAPVTNRVMMRSLREALNVRFGVRQPKALLEIAAWFIRTETELMLKSRFAFPRKLLAGRFVFTFPFIDEAFADLVAEGQAALHEGAGHRSFGNS